MGFCGSSNNNRSQARLDTALFFGVYLLNVYLYYSFYLPTTYIQHSFKYIVNFCLIPMIF